MYKVWRTNFWSWVCQWQRTIERGNGARSDRLWKPSDHKYVCSNGWRSSCWGDGALHCLSAGFSKGEECVFCWLYCNIGTYVCMLGGILPNLNHIGKWCHKACLWMQQWFHQWPWTFTTLWTHPKCSFMLNKIWTCSLSIAETSCSSLISSSSPKCSSLVSSRSLVPPLETPSHMLVCIEVPPPIEIALDIGSFQGWHITESRLPN